jgi:hypothetical protein
MTCSRNPSATTLEKAQNPLADFLDQRLDLFLAGRRRRVEHAAFAVDVGGEDTVEKGRVEVGRKAEVAVRALDDGHRSGLSVGQGARLVPLAVPAGHAVREQPHHLPQQLPAERQREPQRERQRQHELSDGDVGQDVVDQVGRALGHSSA